MNIALIGLALIGGSLFFGKITLQEASQEYLPLDNLKSNSMDVECADLDKDGDADMVIAMEFKPNVLLLNDGTGKMIYSSIGRLPQKNHDSEDIALGDFDRDGDLDIIFVSEDDHVHEYYLNDGKAVFSDASGRFPFNSTANAVDAADFDKDGDLDIIIGNQGQDFFLLNDGKGNFTDETKSRMPADNNTTQDVQSADIDKDGDLDLVLGNEDGNSIYLNDGKAVFTDATATLLPGANEETRKVDIVDIDKDGDMDLFFSNVDFGKNKDKANRILINNGKGMFKDETAARYKAENNMNTGDVAFTDLDGDKDLDLVVANLFGGYSQVLENDGKGVFTDITGQVFSSRITGDAISVEITDLDKNGKPEIYLGMFRGADRFFLVK
jgi:hypothetical protein